MKDKAKKASREGIGERAGQTKRKRGFPLLFPFT